MSGTRSIRSELAQLKAEVEALRHARKTDATSSPPDAPAGPEDIEGQLRELRKLAEDMLSEAEETVAAHPVTSIAAALALGIVIGRLTAR